MESIPQIPIHVTEIKKLILKDSPGYTVESNLDEDRLLNVLTNGSTGRNPTFFKASGHENVFGLRSAIPEGCSTFEVPEDVPKLDEDSDEPTTETNVLYVKLPDGHPVITADMPTTASEPPTPSAPSAPTELSLEEAIEQAEVIFDDSEPLIEESQSTEIEIKQPLPPPEILKVDVTTPVIHNEVANTATTPGVSTKRHSPRISPRLAAAQAKAAITEEITVSTVEATEPSVESDAKLAEALSKSHHNLR